MAASILERQRSTVKETREKTWGNRHVGQVIAESLIGGLKGLGEQPLEVCKQSLKQDTDFARTQKAANFVVDHEAKSGIEMQITSLAQVRAAAIGWIEYYQSLKPKEKESYLAEISKQR